MIWMSVWRFIHTLISPLSGLVLPFPGFPYCLPAVNEAGFYTCPPLNWPADLPFLFECPLRLRRALLVPITALLVLFPATTYPL